MARLNQKLSVANRISRFKSWTPPNVQKPYCTYRDPQTNEPDTSDHVTRLTPLFRLTTLLSSISVDIASFERLILNKAHKCAVRVNEGTDAAAPVLDLGRVEARLPLTSLWQSSFFAGRIEGVEIIQSQTATEPTGQGI